MPFERFWRYPKFCYYYYYYCCFFFSTFRYLCLKPILKLIYVVLRRKILSKTVCICNKYFYWKKRKQEILLPNCCVQYLEKTLAPIFSHSKTLVMVWLAENNFKILVFRLTPKIIFCRILYSKILFVFGSSKINSDFFKPQIYM